MFGAMRRPLRWEWEWWIGNRCRAWGSHSLLASGCQNGPRRQGFASPAPLAVRTPWTAAGRSEASPGQEGMAQEEDGSLVLVGCVHFLWVAKSKSIPRKEQCDE